MLAFSEVAARRGYTSFFYGGAGGRPRAAGGGAVARFPGLQVAGTYALPFRDLTTRKTTR